MQTISFDQLRMLLEGLRGPVNQAMHTAADALKNAADAGKAAGQLAAGAEEWVFTLQDGTTVTKKVLVK